jgi:sortase (surface protein transpeptidase)
MPTNFAQAWRRRIEKKYTLIYKRGPSTVAMFFAGMAIAGWFGFLVASGVPVLQYAWYRLNPQTSARLAQVLQEAATGEVAEARERPQQIDIESELPPVDPGLPPGQYLSIPKIRLDTVIWEAPLDDYESALRKGVWRTPTQATPMGGKPVVLSAHRFGYLAWTNEYRMRHSFYNLPELVEGDEVEIIWEQRRFIYRVSRVVESERIDDYTADLILYTCKFLVSPVRIFVYANLVE